ncbi:dTDP-4-dehydrorhamnose reductase [Bacillus solitudinis]|uniref:dTDP-4-dehydrorhamnose reductase n=1 Tax=Bacillus solitudinis TaxID=2014074 RepID=UPI000C242F2D|nr:dTDP-4-dehydrorhamnose reductase [Bacillus solitudinis]
MRILITGANGQLGKELVKKCSRNNTVIAMTKDELDVTNQEVVEKRMKQIRPNTLIHAAAFTAVDQCELEQKKAFEVNAIGSLNIARAARTNDARMFYISSDYVFDGKKDRPYEEADKPNPTSTYGMSKWLGEQLVQLTVPKSTIIRTSWVYGHGGKNFVNTMLRLAEQQIEVTVVSDQIGCPTYTSDLADIIIQLFDKKAGIYHVSNSGSCSWYEFAKRVFKEAGYDPSMIRPISTEEFGAIAPRPAYSVFSHDKLVSNGSPLPRRWDEALIEFIVKEREK